MLLPPHDNWPVVLTGFVTSAHITMECHRKPTFEIGETLHSAFSILHLQLFWISLIFWKLIAANVTGQNRMISYHWRVTNQDSQKKSSFSNFWQTFSKNFQYTLRLELKLRMIGDAIEGAKNGYGTKYPLSSKTFFKKTNTVCYHTVHELVAWVRP